MRRSFQRLKSPHLARRQKPLCLPADLANAHKPSSLGSADLSIRTQRIFLDFASTSSHKEGTAQMSPLQDG